MFFQSIFLLTIVITPNTIDAVGNTKKIYIIHACSIKYETKSLSHCNWLKININSTPKKTEQMVKTKIIIDNVLYLLFIFSPLQFISPQIQ